MKHKFCLLAFLCLFFNAFAQSKNAVQTLKVGDQMPDVQIANIINSKFKSARISDFKGKLILLDFWNSWCSSCVESFPEIDALQRQYKGKLQVLMVNSKKNKDSPRAVRSVIDRANSWSDHPFKVPIVVADTAISERFAFRGVPFYVWIGTDGRVIAFTGIKEVCPENIERAMAGKPLIIKDLKDKRIVQ